MTNNDLNKSKENHSTEAKDKGTLGQLGEKAKSTIDDGINKAKTQGQDILESKKDAAVHHIEDYAGAVKEAALKLENKDHQAISPYLEQASDSLQQFAQFLQSKSVNSMANDVLNTARKNPGLFIAGSLFAGVLVARFAKASTTTSANQPTASRTSGQYQEPANRAAQHSYKYDSEQLEDVIADTSRRQFES